MGKHKTLLLAGVLVVLLAVSAVAYQNFSQTAQQPTKLSSGQSEQETMMLPAFDIEDMQGSTVSSADFQGKPTIINFWASWCGYCKEEMPDFQTAYETYGDRINFVMIDAVDGIQETKDMGVDYIEQNKYTFPVYFDMEQQAVLSCGVTGFPCSLFVSSDGEVLLYYPGYLSGERILQFCANMLGESTQSEEEAAAS